MTGIFTVIYRTDKGLFVKDFVVTDFKDTVKIQMAATIEIGKFNALKVLHDDVYAEIHEKNSGDLWSYLICTERTSSRSGRYKWHNLRD